MCRTCVLASSSTVTSIGPLLTTARSTRTGRGQANHTRPARPAPMAIDDRAQPAFDKGDWYLSRGGASLVRVHSAGAVRLSRLATSQGGWEYDCAQYYQGRRHWLEVQGDAQPSRGHH